jgi:tetratricopeptide (TPR) repeat protein
VEVAAAEHAMEQAQEAFARFDVEAVLRHLADAVRGFTEAGDPCRAALACAQLGDAMSLVGHVTAARAWFARAERLVADLPPCVEQGWVAMASMGCEVDDPALLLQRSELALDRARRFGDLTLETKALADGGLALVQVGRIDEGMAMLDEAMALACSGASDRLDVAGKSACSFFTACYYAADFGRFGSWSGLLREHGIIGSDPGVQAYLSSHCDSVQAYLLVELGRWGDAEALLEKAIAEFEAVSGAPSWHPAIALADLRTLQGRCTDAETLLLGKDQTPQALLPAARVHLARGDVRLALAAATRGLRAMGTSDRLRAVDLLLVAVEAHVALGDLDAARAELADLHRRVDGLDHPALHARLAAAEARGLAAAGDPTGAARVLQDAVDELDPLAHPWRCALLLLDLAHCEERAGDADAAERAAHAAADVLDGLDVVLDPSTPALLARLTDGERAVSPAPTTAAALRREGAWWTASCGGTTVRLRDSKGLRYLAELVAHPGGERHALDLVDRVEGVGEVDRRSLGDAGPLADAAARTAYRHRIEELRADIADAQADGRDEAALALQEELDVLVLQLASAFGLGGRGRVAGSAAEKARLNVTRALRAALAKLAEALPGPGAALDRQVRTGLYCAYEPAPGEVTWIVQP